MCYTGEKKQKLITKGKPEYIFITKEMMADV